MKLAFWKKEQRASPENPSTSLSNPAEWLVDLLGGETSAAGVRVNETNALSFTTVYSAVSLLSETVAQLPLVLYRRSGDRREVVTDHPAARAVRNPAASMTSYTWRETAQGHVLTWGNGYSFIDRDQLGRPRGLKLLLPDRTRADMVADSLMYTTQINGQRIPVKPEDVVHIPAFGFDGVMGLSPIRTHREAIGAAIAAQRFGSTFFGNGASLGGILKTPKGLQQDSKQRLKEQWDKLKASGYAGTAVLEAGMEYEHIGIPPEDAQFIETRKFSRSEIASIFKIPPHMIGDLDKATFSNIAEQSIQFLRFTMMPWLIKWEEELNRKLLTEAEQGEYFFKFTVQGLQRGTQKDRYDSYNVGINGGFLSRNEVRGWEELNPVEGLDEFLQPLNMAEANDDPDPDEPADEPDPPEEDDERAATLELLQPVVQRFAQTLENVGSSAMVRLLKRDADSFGHRSRTWLDDPKLGATVLHMAEPIAAVMNDEQFGPDLGEQFRTWWGDELQRNDNQPEHIVPLSADRIVQWVQQRYGVLDSED